MDEVLVGKRRLRAELKERQPCCTGCGRKFQDSSKPQIDHIVPRSMGGTNAKTNLQLLHKRCHLAKTRIEQSVLDELGITNDPLRGVKGRLEREALLSARRATPRCASKLPYSTWPEAETAALELMADLRDGKLKVKKGGTVFAYPCADHYHIGHMALWRGSNYPVVDRSNLR